MGIFAQHRRTLAAFAVGLLGILAIALAASAAGARKAGSADDARGDDLGREPRRAHDSRLRRRHRERRPHGCDGLRLSAGGSRVRTRQALCRRGVRHAARDRDRRSRNGRRREADRARARLAATPRPQESPRRPRRLRALRNGHGRGGRHRHGLSARPLGYRPEKHDRARPRCRLLEGRQDPVRRERHDRRGDRTRAADRRSALADGRARSARARRVPGREDGLRDQADPEPRQRDRPEAAHVHGRAHARPAGHAAARSGREGVDHRPAHDAGAAGRGRHANVRLRARPDRAAARHDHRSPATSGRRRTAASRSRRTKAGRARASRSSSTEQGSAVIGTLDYAGRPHGVDLATVLDDDGEDD